MVLEEFYQTIYLDIFYRYIQLKEKQYQEDNVQCTELKEDAYRRCIDFDTEEVKGNVVLWNNGIIEEIITRKSDSKLVFYLHYEIASIAQCQNLFEAFYSAFLRQSTSSPIKILLCCSGGLTTSFFAEKIRKLITLENVNMQVDSVGFHQLSQYYKEYDSIYLAPQIAYLVPEAIKVTKKSIPVYSIEPSIYATYNCQELLHSFVDDNKTTPIC